MLRLSRLINAVPSTIKPFSSLSLLRGLLRAVENLMDKILSLPSAIVNLPCHSFHRPNSTHPLDNSVHPDNPTIQHPSSSSHPSSGREEKQPAKAPLLPGCSEEAGIPLPPIVRSRLPLRETPNNGMDCKLRVQLPLSRQLPLANHRTYQTAIDALTPTSSPVSNTSSNAMHPHHHPRRFDYVAHWCTPHKSSGRGVSFNYQHINMRVRRSSTQRNQHCEGESERLSLWEGIVDDSRAQENRGVGVRGGAVVKYHV